MFDAFFRVHVRLGSGGEGEFDGAIGLLPPGDAEVLFGGLEHRLVNAVELEKTAVIGTDFLFNVSVPPVGGEGVGLAFLTGGAVGGDVVGAFEPDDEFAGCVLGGEAPSLCVPKEFHAEFGAGGFEGGEIADLGFDGDEVGHGGIWVLGF